MQTFQASEFEWFYVGNYGQLGPLAFDQVRGLVRDGVIERNTLVWRTGMNEWLLAESVPELRNEFAPMVVPPAIPPSPPAPGNVVYPQMPQAPMTVPYGADYAMPPVQWNIPESDKSRLIAGILQLIIPGSGRIYLGYLAHGLGQLLLTPACFAGWFWSVVDGIAMLSGSTKYDGYGRALRD